MSTLESLKKSILTECEEDHVGLWSVIRDVEENLPERAESAVRDRVLTLLHELHFVEPRSFGHTTHHHAYCKSKDPSSASQMNSSEKQ